MKYLFNSYAWLVVTGAAVVVAFVIVFAFRVFGVV